MIINKDKIIFIDRNTDNFIVKHLDSNSPAVTPYIKYHDQSSFFNKRCFLITIVIPNVLNSFKIKELLPIEEYQNLIDKKLILVIEYTTDANYRLVELAYKNLVIEQNIPASQILLVCGSTDLITQVEERANFYNIEKVNIEIFYRYEEENLLRFYQDLNVPINEKTPYPKIINPFDQRQFTKKFLNFNGMYRKHRLAFLTLLHNKNLIKDGFISFGKFDKSNWDKTINEAKQSFSDIEDEIEKGKDVYNQLPFILDVRDMYNIDLAGVVRSSMNYYKKSYFSIISETYYDNTYPRFFTEKIIKGFMFKHPFIAIAIPGILDTLKDMGYKTFDSIIDESYDKIKDDGLRLRAISTEVERLCNLNSQEFSLFCDKAKELTEYNFKVLSEKHIFVKQYKY